MGVHDGITDADDACSPLLSRDPSPTDTAYLMSIRIADAMSPPTSPTPRSMTRDPFKSKTPPTSPRRSFSIPYMKRIRNLRGWMVCLAGFIIDIPFMGIVMSFGELLPSFVETFHQNTTASISWVGSLAFGLAYVCCPISTRLYLWFGCRPCAIAGVVLGSLGLFISSFVVEFKWMIVTYSLMFGFATNLTYNAPLVLTGAWFPDEHHVLATCFLVAGIPFGSLVMNPVVESLIASIGLRNAFRVMSALTVVIGLPCCLVFRQPDFDDNADDDEEDELTMEDCDDDDETVIVNRSNNNNEDGDDSASESGWLADMIRREKGPSRIICFFFDRDIWTDPIFHIFMLGQLIKGIGYVFPFIHLVNFMTWLGIEASTASLVMTVKGASDMAGRLAAGVFGERLPFPLVHVYVITCGIMGFVTYIAVFAHGVGVMVFYAIFIGFCNGIYNALLFPLNSSLFRREVRRHSWAFCQVPPGIAIIVGPTMAGAIFDATQSYLYDFLVNTLIFLVAMLIYTSIPIIHLRRKMAARRAELGAPPGLGGAANIIEMTKLFIRGADAEEEFDHDNDHGDLIGTRPGSR